LYFYLSFFILINICLFILLHRAAGRELMLAAPSELAVGNLVRRVLFYIREEHSIHHTNTANQSVKA
jgi:hypothetical protein